MWILTGPKYYMGRKTIKIYAIYVNIEIIPSLVSEIIVFLFEEPDVYYIYVRFLE